MSCEHLICARCAGPVVEGRCPVCRAGREKVHGGGAGLSPAVVVFVLLALLLCTMMLNHLVGG